jgi:hypothetical protein
MGVSKIKRVKKDCYEELCAHNLDNIGKMDKFLESTTYQ